MKNIEIEEKAHFLISEVGDRLEDVNDAVGTPNFNRAKQAYTKSLLKLMCFYDFLKDAINLINENTECFDKEFDKIERKHKVSK